MFALKILILLHICILIYGQDTCNQLPESQDSKFFKSIKQLNTIGFQQCEKICKRYKLCDGISYDRNALRCELMTKSAVPVTPSQPPIHLQQDLQLPRTACTDHPCKETEACIDINDSYACIPDLTFPCPSDDYVLYRSICYHFSSSAASWDTAQAYCSSMNASLARVDNDDVNTFLTNQKGLAESNLIPESRFYEVWLGANDLEHENEFVWVDSGTNITYEKWHPGQPNNFYNEDCLLLTNGMWADRHCTVRNQFVCQVPVQYIWMKNCTIP